MIKHTFKNLAVFTPQEFLGMFGHFLALCKKPFNLWVKQAWNDYAETICGSEQCDNSYLLHGTEMQYSK